MEEADKVREAVKRKMLYLKVPPCKISEKSGNFFTDLGFFLNGPIRTPKTPFYPRPLR